MEVILGKKAGYCQGLRNTIIKTKRYLKKNKEIYCLGQINDNGKKEDKLKIVNNIYEIPDGAKFIIKAHGISKDVYRKLNERNIETIDLTCPEITKVHKQVENYAKLGYYIILITDKEDAEIMATYSFCGKNVSIVKNIQDISVAIENIIRNNIRNVTIFSQSTLSMEKFDKYASIIKKKIPKDTNIEINRTICDSSKLSQIETSEIAKQVELMVIIGSKNSQNTNKMYEICINKCSNAMVVETIEDLYLNYIKRFKKIGVVASMQATKETINEVVEILKKQETENYIFENVR